MPLQTGEISLGFTATAKWHNSEQVLGSGEFWRGKYSSLLSGEKAGSDRGWSSNVPKHHPWDRVMKDGFSQRTALSWCTLFPKLQVERQPQATGCVSWDLSTSPVLRFFQFPLEILFFSPDFSFKLPYYQPTGNASNYVSSPGSL